MRQVYMVWVGLWVCLSSNAVLGNNSDLEAFKKNVKTLHLLVSQAEQVSQLAKAPILQEINSKQWYSQALYVLTAVSIPEQFTLDISFSKDTGKLFDAVSALNDSWPAQTEEQQQAQQKLGSAIQTAYRRTLSVVYSMNRSIYGAYRLMNLSDDESKKLLAGLSSIHFYIQKIMDQLKALRHDREFSWVFPDEALEFETYYGEFFHYYDSASATPYHELDLQGNLGRYFVTLADLPNAPIKPEEVEEFRKALREQQQQAQAAAATAAQKPVEKELPIVQKSRWLRDFCREIREAILRADIQAMPVVYNALRLVLQTLQPGYSPEEQLPPEDPPSEERPKEDVQLPPKPNLSA